MKKALNNVFKATMAAARQKTSETASSSVAKSSSSGGEKTAKMYEGDHVLGNGAFIAYP